MAARLLPHTTAPVWSKFCLKRKACEDARNLCATESPACHVRVPILHTGEYPCQRRGHIMVCCYVERQYKSSVDQLKAIDSKPTGFHRALGSWRLSCQQQTPHCVSGRQSFSGICEITVAQSERSTLPSVSNAFTDESVGSRATKFLRQDLTEANDAVQSGIKRKISEMLSWHTSRTPPSIH